MSISKCLCLLAFSQMVSLDYLPTISRLSNHDILSLKRFKNEFFCMKTYLLISNIKSSSRISIKSQKKALCSHQDVWECQYMWEWPPGIDCIVYCKSCKTAYWLTTTNRNRLHCSFIFQIFLATNWPTQLVCVIRS